MDDATRKYLYRELNRLNLQVNSLKKLISDSVGETSEPVNHFPVPNNPPVVMTGQGSFTKEWNG